MGGLTKAETNDQAKTETGGLGRLKQGREAGVAIGDASGRDAAGAGEVAWEETGGWEGAEAGQGGWSGEG